MKPVAREALPTFPNLPPLQEVEDTPVASSLDPGPHYPLCLRYQILPPLIPLFPTQFIPQDEGPFSSFRWDPFSHPKLQFQVLTKSLEALHQRRQGCLEPVLQIGEWEEENV